MNLMDKVRLAAKRDREKRVEKAKAELLASIRKRRQEEGEEPA